jgi:hypothetical protein
VGQAVEYDELRPAREHRIEVEFAVQGFAIDTPPAREQLQTCQTRQRVAIVTRVEHGNDDLSPPSSNLEVRSFEHRVSLSHARSRAKKYRQAPAGARLACTSHQRKDRIELTASADHGAL